jgi:hypothetical protein
MNTSSRPTGIRLRVATSVFRAVRPLQQTCTSMYLQRDTRVCAAIAILECGHPMQRARLFRGPMDTRCLGTTSVLQDGPRTRHYRTFLLRSSRSPVRAPIGGAQGGLCVQRVGTSRCPRDILVCATIGELPDARTLQLKIASRNARPCKLKAESWRTH